MIEESKVSSQNSPEVQLVTARSISPRSAKTEVQTTESIPFVFGFKVRIA